MGRRRGVEDPRAPRARAVAGLSALTLLGSCGGDSTVVPELPSPSPAPAPVVVQAADVPDEEAEDAFVRNPPRMEVRVTTLDGTPVERAHLHDTFFFLWDGWTDSTGTALVPEACSRTLQVAAEGFAPLLDTGVVEDGEVLVLEPCRWVELVLDERIALPAPPEDLAVYLAEAHRNGERSVSTCGVDYRGEPLVDLMYSFGANRRVRLAIPTARRVGVSWAVTRRDDTGDIQSCVDWAGVTWIPSAPQNSVVVAPSPEDLATYLERLRDL